MSQSPDDSSQRDPRGRYIAAARAVSNMLEEGRSFSGRERHCCFLNTGGSGFADVSAVTGLDLIDDGRAVAVVDWDQDGDLDFWVTNRTAPSVRYLDNDPGVANRFLAVRLTGKTCNRDAIGARAELVLTNPQRRLIRTVRAGEGFLAQSSKWLHFGLGRTNSIDRLIVHWPGGEPEDFTVLAVDERYEIEQGSGIAVSWNSPRQNKVRLTASEPNVPTSTDAARIVLLSRVPIGDLAYRSSNGGRARVADAHEGPYLVNLWASWCAPCIVELQEFANRKGELRSAGLQILALNVDNLHTRHTERTRRNLEELTAAFAAGAADEETVGKLEQLQRLILNRIRPLPIPTSFLIDANDRVAVMYKGPVTVDQLLADRDLLDATPSEIRDAAVPFAGRWTRQLAQQYQDVLTARNLIGALLAQTRNVALGGTVLIMLTSFVVYRRWKRTAVSPHKTDH